MKTFKLLLPILAIFAWQTPVLAQQVFLVNAGESIQQSILMADDGDTVRVAEGVFDESLYIHKKIVLEGAGPFKTILTGGNASGISLAYFQKRTVLVQTTATIDGFGIIEETRNVDQNHNNMGILLEGVDDCVIRNCRIENHITGIYLSGSSNTTIEDNILQFNGNAILFAAFAQNSDQNEIKNNLITENGIANETDDAGVRLISNYSGTNNNIESNDLYNNTFGVRNQTSNTIDALGNWWGNNTGPTHSGNSGGLGDAVSDFVNYGNSVGNSINNTLSTEEVLSKKLESFNIYPNPAFSQTNISFNLNTEASFSLVVLDLQGRVVNASSAQLLPPGEFTQVLNTTSLPGGYYLINLLIDGEANMQRLVVH